jgi:type II secretory pathway pseudopilin PulG
MRRRGDGGYVLLGIIIWFVILAIFMVAAVPLWQKLVQREREKELIFRGYQYMQAIELYQRKFPGAFPPNLEILVEQKFLRKLYPDPMTEDGEWRVLRQLSPELQMGAQQARGAVGSAAGITELNRSRAQMRTPGGQTVGGQGAGSFGARQGQPTGGQFRSSLGRGQSEQGLGGVVGVASKSEEETFYLVPGKEKYKDWLFVYGVPTLAPVAQVARPGRAAGAGAAAQALNASPFPGLPPPPGLTQFRFGSQVTGAQQQPGVTSPVPGTTPGTSPRQPGLRPGTNPGLGSTPGGFPGGGMQQPQRPQQRRRQP